MITWFEARIRSLTVKPPVFVNTARWSRRRPRRNLKSVRAEVCGPAVGLVRGSGTKGPVVNDIMVAGQDLGLASTPLESQGEAAREAVGWNEALGWTGSAVTVHPSRFTAAEKSTWPSVSLFALSPLGYARSDAVGDTDELRECLLSWKRKRLQKLARVLRVNPALSNLELVSMVLETTAAVRQRPHSGDGSNTTGKTPTLRRRAGSTGTTAPEEPQHGRGSRQRKSRGQVVTGLAVDAESPCEGEPRGKTVAGTANSLSTADLPADPQCNAQCQECKLPFYTASGKAVCVDCREGESPVDDVVCVSCGRGDSEELLMLCEGCENACHAFCCEPRLDTIPESDWFCGSCSGRRKTQKHFADCSLQSSASNNRAAGRAATRCAARQR